MKKFISTLLTILIISVIILIHEFGHFATMKYFDVPVKTFSLGFGSALIDTKIGQTTYQIALIPIGGYVLPDESIKDLNFWPTVIIYIAGIFMNLLMVIMSSAIMKRFIVKKEKYFIIALANSFIYSSVIFIKGLFMMLTEIFTFKMKLNIIPSKDKFTKIINQETTPKKTNQGKEYLMYFLAINLSLAFINMIPIQILDGGKVLYALIKVISNEDMANSIMSWVSSIIIVFVFFAIFKPKKSQKQPRG